MKAVFPETCEGEGGDEVPKTSNTGSAGSSLSPEGHEQEQGCWTQTQREVCKGGRQEATERRSLHRSSGPEVSTDVCSPLSFTCPLLSGRFFFSVECTEKSEGTDASRLG